jgi:hypothetical protein
MDIETIRRISLARHLYQLAGTSLRSKNNLQLFAAVNLLQDAVESFLLAVGDHVGAKFPKRPDFDDYFSAINQQITPKELPFRAKLKRLNLIRVDSKHHGIQPARDECDRVALTVREFFEEVTTSLVGANFSTVSAIDLLDDGETKDLLVAAKSALESAELETTVIECRKALYLEVENRYDVSEFKNGKPTGLMAAFTYAPDYAQQPAYIQSNVKDPSEFIVRDHTRIDHDLMKDGIDTTSFWNVCRMTPEVYRRKDKSWLIKHDFAKLAAEVLSDKAEYVLNTTVDIVLGIHTARSAIRGSHYELFFVQLAREGVPIYEKADRTSKVVGITPAGMTQIDTPFRIAGLVDDGPYWFVHHFNEPPWLYGYVHNDDVAYERRDS